MNGGATKASRHWGMWAREVGVKFQLHPTDRLIAFAVATYVNKETGTAWPSWAELQQATGLKRARVHRGLKLLKDLRIIEPVGVVGRNGVVLWMPNAGAADPSTTVDPTVTRDVTGDAPVHGDGRPRSTTVDAPRLPAWTAPVHGDGRPPSTTVDSELPGETAPEFSIETPEEFTSPSGPSSGSRAGEPARTHEGGPPNERADGSNVHQSIDEEVEVEILSPPTEAELRELQAAGFAGARARLEKRDS